MDNENLVKVGANPDQDNNVNEKMSSTTFRAGLQCFTSLFMGRGANIGLRTLRNTAHLFGILGAETGTACAKLLATQALILTTGMRKAIQHCLN